MVASSLIWSPPNGGFDSASRHYARYADARPGGSPERYRLKPGEPLHLQLAAGDLITLINDEGSTSALLLPFNATGEVVAAALGLQSPCVWCRIDQSPAYSRFWQWYAAQGVNSTDLSAIAVFDKLTPRAERFTLRVTETVDLWCLIQVALNDVLEGGAGGAMSMEVTRVSANPDNAALPQPLGKVRDEFTVAAGTALAYPLKAGEFVQIIDVEGRQCSDFMAMRASALDAGEERFIDSTVTRSMTGGAYPGPGLFDKFFDQDMKPLLNVRQDTVGRHDTFAYACTARGYEERGFFGHLNCSDNISHAYAPYGIRKRDAWPAINFFFNSWILPDDNRIQSDEAWSQAGDYVALQAMTDLVCVSTACPDDVDPINGWNPTDIHVRIYSENSPIQHAVAYRATPDTEASLTEHSAFHPRTSKLTRDFHVARDVWAPASYESTRANEEYQACRQGVTLQDMSSLRKFDILGPDAAALLQTTMTRDISKLSLNRGVYALLCDETGAVLDDGTLFRLTPDAYRWCCGSDESARHLARIAEELKLNVWIKSLFSAMPNLAIQGPKSRDLLRSLVFTQPTATSIENLKWFGCTVARLHDRDGHAFLLTRTGYTGELGYEIFCDQTAALPIWDALMAAGDAYAITPMGGAALEVIRIEAGLMAAGAEFTADVDAFEAGLGFAVDLKKPTFIGREALQRNALATRRKLVGLKLKGDEVPVHGDGVFMGERQIGVITSATRSPALGCAIAMARVAAEYSELERALDIGKLGGHQKRLHATVCQIPFVDPSRSRARA